MIEKYLNSASNAIEQCDFIFSPTIRLTHSVNIASTERNESISGFLYGSSSKGLKKAQRVKDSYEQLNLL